MKKILALTLAAVMAAGMSTVAFADLDDTTPIIGVSGTTRDPLAENHYLFKLNADGKATEVYDINEDVQLKGGDQIAIPMVIWTDNSTANDDNFVARDTVEWYTYRNSADYKDEPDVYADWDVGDAEVAVKLVNYDVSDDRPDVTAEGLDGRVWSVVVTIPENDTNHIDDLAGTIKVGTTRTRARNSDYSYKLNLSFAPDGTDANIVKKFDGDDTLDVGFTGIVAFEDDLGEIDIEFDDDAMFTVDVTGQSKLNLRYNCDFDAETAAMYDYANIDFITFEAEPTFNKTGTMYIYADEDAFVYEVVEDGVKKIDGLKWNEDYEAWEFKTRKLTSYAISDVELDEKTVTEDNSSSATEDGNKANPDTGR